MVWLASLILALVLCFVNACQNESSCNAGCYMTTQGCLPCHAGSFAEAGSTECSICPPGRFAQAQSGECTSCPVGTYAFAESSSCDDCPTSGNSSPLSGSQCDINLCGHTCHEVIVQQYESKDNSCEWTWADGCKNEAPPTPFTKSSTLHEMCPQQCAKINTTGQLHYESPDPHFIPIDGGKNVACRGTDTNDNNASNYEVTEESHMTLRKCRELCVGHGNCTGIEFKQFWGGTTRCEVWVVPIGATVSESDRVSLHGFLCLRYVPENEETSSAVSWRTATASRTIAMLFMFTWAVL